MINERTGPAFSLLNISRIFMNISCYAHGTSFAFKWTHPSGVLNLFSFPGSGEPVLILAGGLNTDAIKSPTTAPIKIQRRDIIYYLTDRLFYDTL